MSDVDRHYSLLLAKHYTWMTGMPFEDKVAEQQALLKDIGIRPQTPSMAVDLGSGPGYQSVAVAKLGFARVIAVDTSRALLDELLAAKADLPIETIHADLNNLPQFVGTNGADAIVCMGDTLTHLAHQSDVSRLFANAYTALVPGGTFVVSFRDLTTELTGTDRFLPVRADRDRIMTCVLDYEPASVIVTDLIHERDGETWTLHKSSYRKLRLDPAAMTAELVELGFEVRRHQPEGRLCILAATKL